MRNLQRGFHHQSAGKLFDTLEKAGDLKRTATQVLAHEFPVYRGNTVQPLVNE